MNGWMVNEWMDRQLDGIIYTFVILLMSLKQAKAEVLRANRVKGH